MESKYYACIDIGGTAIKYGLAREDGRFYETRTAPTEVREKGIGPMLQKVIAIVEGYKAERLLQGIAVSTAGVVDPHTGEIIYASESFPGYRGTKVKAILEAACGLPCSVENDVNAAGLGEYWRGAGQGAASLFCLTVGTGIGGCVILEGHLFHGASNSAGEIGYMATGGQASFEESASVTALIRRVAALKGVCAKTLDGHSIFRLADAGDVAAARALQEMTGSLASGIANVCCVLNPQVVIVGGGIMARQSYFAPRLTELLRQKLPAPLLQNTHLVFAKLQNEAGMTGALYHFLQQHP